MRSHQFMIYFALAAAVAGLFVNCGRSDANWVQGYIEGEFVYVSAPLAGALEELRVSRGDQVEAGSLLFLLDDAPESAALKEAERRLSQGRARLEDAQKGRRPAEIAALESQLEEARAGLKYSEQEWMRQKELIQTPGATTNQDLERVKSEFERDRHRAARFEAELESARLGERPDQIEGLQANVAALEAAAERARWALSQKRQSAPRTGSVHDTLYREGEWIPSGRPVVVLLPPASVKLQTFVPEPWLSRIQAGDSVRVRVDGKTDEVIGTIRFIASKAEYTPPTVYSRANRSKFVYRVEAGFEPEAAVHLHPGQPVDALFDLSARP